MSDVMLNFLFKAESPTFKDLKSLSLKLLMKD